MNQTVRILKNSWWLGVLLLAACSGNGDNAASSSSTAAQVVSGNTTNAADGSSAGGLLSSPNCSMQYRAGTAASTLGDDPLFAQQWHLKNTGQVNGLIGEDLNVSAAWDSSRGAGVRVAVVDNSLETVHNDLIDNVVPRESHSYRAEQDGYSDPLPCYASETHGTSVAGLIAARSGNAAGGVGVAPMAKLVGYNALATNTDADLADALVRDLNKNSVYSSSWGSSDDGLLHPVSSLHELALNTGLRTGRGGLGALYVFAAGNGGCFRTGGDGTICESDNTNFDGYLTQLGAIVVGAVDRSGRAPRYAEPGANLLVSAPGGDSSLGMTTTAIRNGYTQSFVGSSAATPMVSGVIALMLSVNPALSWRDVRIILASTARRNDPTHSSWRNNPRGQTGQPVWFSHRYGYGVVDAGAAVKAAKSWQSVGTSEQLKSCGPFEIDANVQIPDAAGAVSSSLAISAQQCDIRNIEFVNVRASINHEYSGDLAISIRSPADTDSELANPRHCAGSNRDADRCGRYDGWNFASVRHLGEAVAGEWRLSVNDVEAGKIGQLVRWSVKFYGR
jgi:proprotein convertase subtilisin/kexin type 2